MKTMILAALMLNGCAIYEFQHTNADGSQTSLKIYSTREVQAADLNIGPDGTLQGNAEKLGANERLLELLQTAVKKIP